MRPLRLRPISCRVLLFAAVVTLLPPGAWSLCVDRDGHVAIEPTAGACADMDPTSAATADACGAASHDECEDYVLLYGQLTTRPTVTHSDLVPATSFLAAVDFHPAECKLELVIAPVRAQWPRSSGAPSILRC